MSIPLKEFEQHIDATIVARGRSYYNSGQVGEVEELYPGLFEATILGTVLYNVRIQLEGDQITQYSCTCPYDYGPVCKHVVSLMYYIRRDVKSGSQSKLRKSSKRKTVSQQMDELLSKISHEDLTSFSKELAVKDKQYRRKIMAAFMHLNQNESKAFHAGQVRAILQAVSDEYGFIGWHEVSTVGYQVHELLDTAEEHVGNKRYESALFICFAVMEEIVKALDFADDSNGDISGCIYRAFEMIHNIASESLPGPISKQLFDYCFSAFDEGAFSEWDWNIDMLEILTMIYETKEEAEYILELIESTALSDYDLEQAQRIQLQIIEDIKSNEEAAQFMTQHISNPEIRAVAIHNAVADKQYDKAITIALDGIKHDAKDKPGLVYNWYRHLLNIATLQNNKERIIEYARILFIDSIFEKQPYYFTLKKQVPSARWTDFVEDLIADIQKKNRWLDVNLIAQIYINEQWWDRLLKLVMEKPTLEKIESYEQYLSKDYATEVAGLYKKEIVSLLEENTGRTYYRKACRFIQRMEKLGQHNQANQLVKKLKTTYPNRPALIEELNALAM